MRSHKTVSVWSYLFCGCNNGEIWMYYLNTHIIKLIIGATTESERDGISLLILALVCSLVMRGHQHETNVLFFPVRQTNVICITVSCCWSLIDVFSLVQSKLATLQVNFLSTFQWLSLPLKTGIHNEWRQFSSQLECLSRLSSPIVLPLPLVGAMNFHEGQTLYFR